MRSLLAASVVVSAVACGAPTPEPAPPSAPRPVFGRARGELREGVSPDAYRLELAVDPSADRYSGTVEIDFSQRASHESLWLSARNASVRGAELRGEAGFSSAPFRQDSGMVEVLFPRPMRAGRLSVRLSFDAPFSSGERGLVRSARGGDRYAATMLEPTFARDVFPCFDAPRFRAPLELGLTVPEAAVAIANAPEKSTAPAGHGARRVLFAPTAALPSYLFGFAVGPFEIAPTKRIAPTEVRARPLEVRVLAPRGRAGALLDVLDDAAELLPEIERYVGIAYPFDKLDFVAVPDVTSGMENPGEIVLPGWWASVDPADRPIEWRREIRSWVVHELVHQWFGDLVTVSGWEHLWAKEGAATWLEAKLLDARHPEDDASIDLLGSVHRAMVDDESADFPLAPRTRPDATASDAYGAITYDKGAAVLGAFERWLSPDPFRAGIRSYLEGHALGSASSQALVLAVTRAAGQGATDAMWSFMGAGVPVVDVQVECTKDRRELVLRPEAWVRFGAEHRASTWKIPFCALYPAGGRNREACTVLDAAEARLRLDGAECPTWVHPNAAAAGYYRWTLAPDQLQRLVERAPSLSVRERLSLADSVRAAFRRGTLPAADAFGALEKLASDPDRRVAYSVAPLIELASGWFEDEPATRDAIQRRARRLYAAEKAHGPWAAPERTAPALRAQAQRSWVLGFLARTARDPDVRAEALRRGRAYLGVGGDSRLHTEAAPWDLARIALEVAIQDGDASVLEVAIGRLGEAEDDLIRRTLLQALGRARRPEASARIRALALDPRLRRDEVLMLLEGQFESEETRDVTLGWVDERAPEIERRLGRGALLGMIANVGRACDERHLAMVRARLDRDSGHGDDWRRSLEAAAERIGRCIERRAAQVPAIRAFFTR